MATLTIRDLRGAEHRQEVAQCRHRGKGEQGVGDGRGPLAQQGFEPDGKDGTDDGNAQRAEHHPATLAGGQRIGDVEGELTQFGTTVEEGDQTQSHTDSRGNETYVVAVMVLEEAGDDRREERSNTDRHVEVQETLIAAGVTVIVKTSYHRGEVRLDKARANGDADEADP